MEQRDLFGNISIKGIKWAFYINVQANLCTIFTSTCFNVQLDIQSTYTRASCLDAESLANRFKSFFNTLSTIGPTACTQKKPRNQSSTYKNAISSAKASNSCWQHASFKHHNLQYVHIIGTSCHNKQGRERWKPYRAKWSHNVWQLIWYRQLQKIEKTKSISYRKALTTSCTNSCCTCICKLTSTLHALGPWG